ncbi:MAG TPA: 4Fe-4S dicluster domain-containing protein [Flavobacteriales bacterium]|jgi:heterodisulfide reductase subunit C|nr:4Fe-4S dicluster domain-containing protein [Flavobacteriales bacterium]
MIASIVFVLLLAAATGWFARNVIKVRRNINLGRPEDRTDNPGERWGIMARVALGQSKMVTRPIAGFLHIIVYAGFVIINIEVLEIIIDGIFGTHRVFSFLGPFYGFLIGSFEWLALGVWVACAIFLVRRYLMKMKRFLMKELDGWPRTDATLILCTEIALMTAFLTMNAADITLQGKGVEHYVQAGAFPVSGAVAALFNFRTFEPSNLVLIERICWWFHIIGILAFLNYLPYSKHFHIVLAFPNTWFSSLRPKTEIKNMERVTGEVKSMLDPSVPPPAAATSHTVAGAEMPERFGAKDVFDLTWKNLMDAYSCTECGRCTSECPANITGKLLSPRKIMMDTRDRLEEVGKVIDAKGKWEDDGKSLHSRISEEELWACTTCNACTQACPVNIDPVGIIIDMRRYLVMEESRTRPALTGMFNNVENNGAPWAFAQSERMKWTES